jgi:hypothetical protein
MGGAESKALFQKITTQLVSDNPKVNPFDEKFWALFWTLPSSIDDVFSLLKISDIQELRYKNPKNFVMLVYKVYFPFFNPLQHLFLLKHYFSNFQYLLM